MTVRSGRKCSALLMNPNRAGCLVKTCLESSHWNSTVCFLTWNLSVTPRGRLCFRLVPAMPSTAETECGLWPTPLVGSTNEAAHNQISGRFREAMAKKMALWPTPRSGKTSDETEEAWTARRDAGKVSTPPLTLAVKMWPTPTASTGGPEPEGKTGRKLATIAKLYPTMDVGAAKGRGAESAEQRSRLGGSLNPTWVEWLMGYPAGWTDCGDSETPSSRKSPPR